MLLWPLSFPTRCERTLQNSDRSKKATNLQLVDLMRHGNLTKNQRQFNKFHAAAVQFMAGTSSTSVDEQTNPDKNKRKTGVIGAPTAAQLRVAAEVVFSSLGA